LIAKLDARIVFAQGLVCDFSGGCRLAPVIIMLGAWVCAFSAIALTRLRGWRTDFEKLLPNPRIPTAVPELGWH
jgi:hypothetical protein